MDCRQVENVRLATMSNYSDTHGSMVASRVLYILTSHLSITVHGSLTLGQVKYNQYIHTGDISMSGQGLSKSDRLIIKVERLREGCTILSLQSLLFLRPVFPLTVYIFSPGLYPQNAHFWHNRDMEAVRGKKEKRREREREVQHTIRLYQDLSLPVPNKARLFWGQEQ